MNLKQAQIAGVGEVLWDIYPQGRFPGGAPANFAAHIAQAGAHAVLCSRVGDDEPGTALKKELLRYNIDLVGLQTDPARKTGTVVVTLDAAGQPSFLCSKDVAFDALSYDASWQIIAPQLHGLLFGTLAQRNLQSRKAIQSFLCAAHQAVKLFDINLRGWNKETAGIVEFGLSVCDILKMNETEFNLLHQAKSPQSGDLAFIRQLLMDYDIKLVAVTLGKLGCILYDCHAQVVHSGFDVVAVDTTGCGDAFAAGLLLKYLQKSSLEEMAEFANRLGAFVATRTGAVPDWHHEDIAGLTPNPPSHEG